MATVTIRKHYGCKGEEIAVYEAGSEREDDLIRALDTALLELGKSGKQFATHEEAKSWSDDVAQSRRTLKTLRDEILSDHDDAP